MNKTTQLANIRVGYCDFKITVNRADGVDCHKTLEASYENYAETIETVARLQDYYINFCRIPKVKELSR